MKSLHKEEMMKLINYALQQQIEYLSEEKSKQHFMLLNIGIKMQYGLKICKFIYLIQYNMQETKNTFL